MSGNKTAIITGASGGIGAGLVEGFLREGYNVVATSREANRKLTSSSSLILLDGDIGEQQTAAHAVEAAISNFGAIDVLVNNAGIFLTKPFIDFTTEDFEALVSTNLLGFFYITQRTVSEMLKQKSGCVVSIGADFDAPGHIDTALLDNIGVSRNSDFYLCAHLHSCRTCAMGCETGVCSRRMCTRKSLVLSMLLPLVWRRLFTPLTCHKGRLDLAPQSHSRATGLPSRGIVSLRVCLNWRKRVMFRSDGHAGLESVIPA
jgi:hypothetical protein